mgnify:FL=1
MKMQIVAAVCAGTALGLFAVNGTKERAMRQPGFQEGVPGFERGQGQ